MEFNRKITIEEEKLIEKLIEKSSKIISADWKNNLLVRQMNDGEMGSLYLFPNGKIIEDRIFGEQVSELQFKDIDGVDVIASLNVDTFGNLFELDIWKVDFSKLISLSHI